MGGPRCWSPPWAGGGNRSFAAILSETLHGMPSFTSLRIVDRISIVNSKKGFAQDVVSNDVI
jgi:hypothetical protein